MGHHRSSHRLAHLLCLLPVLLILVLTLFEIRLPLLLVPVLMLLCCLAMAYVMADACAHDRPVAPDRAPEPPPAPAHHGSAVEDVFRVEHVRRVGDATVLEGELLRGPGEVYEALRQRYRGTDTVPLLQEGADGRPVVVLVPRGPESADAPAPGPWVPALLLVATLATTTWAGAAHAGADLLREPARFVAGLPYALALLLILGVHEAGHYLAARAHGMRVSPPYFIPAPFGLGTFGALIRLRSPAGNRRALFDVAAAGPLAGLAVALPALWIGLQYSSVVPAQGAGGHAGGVDVGSSVLFAAVAKPAVGDVLAQGHVLVLHPVAFAGWLGLLITALNLVPIGQLDGGRVADAMFGRRRGAAVATAAVVALFALGLFVWGGLLGWAIVVYFIAGAKDLPPLDDVSRLGGGRLALGWFTFALLVLILAPVPHRLYGPLNLGCPYL
jgi:Zn-dependent protease